MKITTKEEARQYAIDWQSKFNETSHDWQAIADYQAEFQELAERFDLVEEFKENGII